MVCLLLQMYAMLLAADSGEMDSFLQHEMQNLTPEMQALGMGLQHPAQIHQVCLKPRPDPPGMSEAWSKSTSMPKTHQIHQVCLKPGPTPQVCPKPTRSTRYA